MLLYLSVSKNILMVSCIECQYSIKEIRKYLGVSRDTVLAWMKSSVAVENKGAHDGCKETKSL